MDSSSRLFHALVMVGASLTGATSACGGAPAVDAQAALDAAADGARGAGADGAGDSYADIRAPDAAWDAYVTISFYGDGYPTIFAPGLDAYANISPCAVPQLHPQSCMPNDGAVPDGSGSADAGEQADVARNADAYPTIRPPPPNYGSILVR
jgi:hypothetical protein